MGTHHHFVGGQVQQRVVGEEGDVFYRAGLEAVFWPANGARRGSGMARSIIEERGAGANILNNLMLPIWECQTQAEWSEIYDHSTNPVNENGFFALLFNCSKVFRI